MGVLWANNFSKKKKKLFSAYKVTYVRMLTLADYIYSRLDLTFVCVCVCVWENYIINIYLVEQR